jgi:His-Xaa-Ser system protein HxsD
MYINKKTIKLNKNIINEISLRNCLYWVDENITWELLEDDVKWEINLTGSSDLVKKELQLLNSNINDNILRFNLSRESHSTREKIIKNALLKLSKNE